MMRKVLTALPVTANRLETALHAACDSGHWEGEVQLVLDKDTNTYRLELVYDENTGPCPHCRSVWKYVDGAYYTGCSASGGPERCLGGGRLPCPYSGNTSTTKEEDK